MVPMTMASNAAARSRSPAISASDGATSTTTSSTEANRVRNARASPGATADDVSAGVRSAGWGMIARIRAVGARAIVAGSVPSVGRVQAGQRPLRQLAGHGSMLGGADHVEVGRGSEPGQPRPQLGEATG